MYAKAFFDLQLQFADRVTALSGLPLPRVLLEYTNLYIRLGLGRAFDPSHPTWREYVAGLDTKDRGEWTYRFYLTRSEGDGAPAVVATFGCFSYSRLSDGRLRLHFQNVETEGHSPLGRQRLGQRLAELTALFEHVKRTLHPPLEVRGASWLYNLEAYRRLFPGSYLASARAMTRRFQHMPLWGQFLDRHGEIKGDLTRQFLERLGRQESTEGLDQCFPLQVLAVEASVQDFYDFYGISSRPSHAFH